MRIQIHSTYYAPERSGNAPYVTGLADFLVGRGHHVSVLTAFPHYPTWQPPAATTIAMREQLAGVEVIRRRHFVPKKQSALRRGMYELTFLVSGATAIPGTGAPDVVVGMMPTLAAGALAAAAAHFRSAPLVVVLQDLQGLGAEQSGIRNGRRVAGAVSRLEAAVVRRAQHVAVVAEGFRPHVIAAGVAPNRVHRVRNWPIYTPPAAGREAIRRELGWQERDFVCLHAGNMGNKQGLANVLAAAALLPDDAPVRIVLAGDGNDRQRLEHEAARLRLRNLSFLGSRPSDGSWEALLVGADVLLVHQRATVTDMSLPSKLSTYFAAGRPILAAVNPNSEAAREVTVSGAGVVVRPGDPQALARALSEMTAARLVEIGAAARRYADAVLSRDVALSRLEEIIRMAAVEPSVFRTPDAPGIAA